RRVKENKIAIIHEGWERLGKRIQLKNKTHYLHTGSGSTFWEGFGDFLIEHYDVDEDTWLVVNGDGAEWIGECESYFHRCIYTLDRFHVARELKHGLRELPVHWKAVRRALAAYDPQGLFAAMDAIPKESIPEDRRTDWERLKGFLRGHEKHLVDYRKILAANGIDTTGMRPMGSAESQMRVFAKRTKRGGYSWSVRGVQAMLRSSIAPNEGRLHGGDVRENKPACTQQEKPGFRLNDLFKPPKEYRTGVVNGLLRTLQTSKQSSPLRMALKGLRA